MQITVKNCNNIDHAEISIIENKLNIKFASNGTGKSTLSKAIIYKAENKEDSLKELIPFKLKSDNPENLTPQVIGIDSIRSVMCFSEEYINQIVFKPNELVDKSFDIFIRNDDYQAIETEIDNLILKIKNSFLDNQELDDLISNLEELGKPFKLTRSGLSKTSNGIKCLSSGNKIKHIPEDLKPFSDFIGSDKNINWIDWQIKGYDFLELSDSCPFCTSETKDRKEQIQQVGREYNKNEIKNLVGLIDVIERLGDYFSTETRDNLGTITTLEESLEDEHEAFLYTVIKQIDNFVDKLRKLKGLSGFEFKDGNDVPTKLASYQLDLSFFNTLNSEKTQNAIEVINHSIEELIQEAGILRGKINRRNITIKNLINKYQTEINQFLKYAGYRYEVAIVGEDEQSQLRLRHLDYDEHLSGGKQHLSFGERNAFSLVLFMYECLSKKPDLIVLDDPVSSFDNHKKYAILEMLFRKNSDDCLKRKTVLMLTHDIEPIIDTLKSVAKPFGNQVYASFLKNSANIITELTIEKDDIQTFPKICQAIISSEKDDIIKLIYLRRFYEVTDDKGDAYQVLSNLFHKRNNALDMREDRNSDGECPDMEGTKFNSGCNQIREYIEDFDYQILLNRISDFNTLKSVYDLCQNGYERLQLFRLFDFPINNSVIQKFANETYHIENELICQLHPDKFDMIPEYVIEVCNQCIAECAPTTAQSQTPSPPPTPPNTAVTPP